VPAIADFQASNTDVDATVVAVYAFLQNKLRGAMHTVSLTDLSVGVINQILNQTDYYYDGESSFTSGASLIVFIEPFIPTGGVTSPNDDTAYPHT